MRISAALEIDPEAVPPKGIDLWASSTLTLLGGAAWREDPLATLCPPKELTQEKHVPVSVELAQKVDPFASKASGSTSKAAEILTVDGRNDLARLN